MADKLTIIKDLKEHLQKGYHDTVKEIILFGSRANGNSNEYSDYDILIVLDNDYTFQDERRIYDLCYEIDLKYDIIIDPHMISLRELTTLRGKQPIFTNAIQTGLYA
jgi:predicted nucleotidyltransferase